MARAPSSDAFQRWVAANGGSIKVAERLDVGQFTVEHWYYRRGWPRTKSIIDLIRISKGELTFESIIESTTPPSKLKAVKRSLG